MSWALDSYVRVLYLLLTFLFFFSINSFICTSECRVVTVSENWTAELKDTKKKNIMPHNDRQGMCMLEKNTFIDHAATEHDVKHWHREKKKKRFQLDSHIQLTNYLLWEQF